MDGHVIYHGNRHSVDIDDVIRGHATIPHLAAIHGSSVWSRSLYK